MKTTVRAGEWDLGVRAGSTEIDGLIRGLLGDRCRDGLTPPANYSISAESAAQGPVRMLPTLYGGHKALLRSRSLPLLAGGLLANLAAHEQAAQDSRLVWLDVSTLVTADGRAILASPAHRSDIVHRMRTIRRLGLRYHPAREVAVDPATGQLVIAALGGVDQRAADVLHADDDAAETLVPPGRYPVAGWAVGGAATDEPVSRAQAVLRTFALATNRDQIGAQTVLDTLGQLFAGTRAGYLGGGGEQVVAGLGQLARDTR